MLALLDKPAYYIAGLRAEKLPPAERWAIALSSMYTRVNGGPSGCTRRPWGRRAQAIARAIPTFQAALQDQQPQAIAEHRRKFTELLDRIDHEFRL